MDHAIRDEDVAVHKATYGPFGDDPRLYCIFHQGNYSGGHPSTNFDASHDFRNVTDCGPGPWDNPSYDIPSHEIGRSIVEGASNGVHGSPAFGLWHDSKWIEIYQYDVYKAVGMEQDAKRLFDKFTATSRINFRARTATGFAIGTTRSIETTGNLACSRDSSSCSRSTTGQSSRTTERTKPTPVT